MKNLIDKSRFSEDGRYHNEIEGYILLCKMVFHVFMSISCYIKYIYVKYLTKLLHESIPLIKYECKLNVCVKSETVEALH